MTKDDTRQVLYARATYGSEERDAVNAVLDNPKALVGGPKTAEMERRAADRFGKDHGVMVNSGSSANLLAVELLNLPRGAEVITPLVTFSTTVAPLVQKGLVPVFVDIGLGDYLLDIDQVRSVITENTEALMIPSLLGNIPNYPEFRQLADEHDLYLIEDSADTIGASIAGSPTGVFTDISTTSFYGSHIITAFGGGGMVAVNDDEWMQRLKKLRGWGRKSAVDETESITDRLNTQLGDITYDSKFIFDELGYNFLPLEASAAFGVEQLKKLETFSSLRKNNFQSHLQFFSQYDDWFVLPKQRDDVETCWLAFPLTIREEAPFTRAELVTHLENNGIQTRSLWSGNLLKHPGFEDIECRLPLDSYPNANRVMQSAFVIGAHQSMGQAEREYVRETFTEFFDGL
ncbi:DegT/DnrJ/EryC1/StrS family aminotransferase [Natronomonas sp. EA1]|uniref:DegT/DnrJ/EryC1/StrS family aminotransferase n=1 Tax=Natronomonas sp. EA1 TaxID=3421655 RepID=UPI003EBA4FDA